MPRIAQGWYKPCLNCQKEFYVCPSTNHRQYCQKKCRSEHRKAVRESEASRSSYATYAIKVTICPVCKKEVTERRPKNIATCSSECARILSREKRRSGYNDACGVCGMGVYIANHRYESSKTKIFFCSASHANEYQGRNKIKYTCETCGELFRRSPCWERMGKPQRYCNQGCRDADPQNKERLLEMNRLQQLGNTTQLEKAGYEILDSLGLLYFRQHLIAGKFCVDSFLFSHNLIIQFDGDYWHGNPKKFSNLDNRQKKRMRLDKSQDAYMVKCNYRVLRIWESEMKESRELVKERILAALSVR